VDKVDILILRSNITLIDKSNHLNNLLLVTNYYNKKASLRGFFVLVILNFLIALLE